MPGGLWNLQTLVERDARRAPRFATSSGSIAEAGSDVCCGKTAIDSGTDAQITAKLRGELDAGACGGAAHGERREHGARASGLTVSSATVHSTRVAAHWPRATRAAATESPSGAPSSASKTATPCESSWPRVTTRLTTPPTLTASIGTVSRTICAPRAPPPDSRAPASCSPLEMPSAETKAQQ